MGGSRIVGPALLIGMLVGAGLGAGAVAYQVSAASHVASLGRTPASAIVLAVDVLGVTLALAFSLELMLGFRFFTAARRQSLLHRKFSWPLVAIVVAHGAGATWHTFVPPREPLPFLLVALGLVVFLALLWQVLGARNPRPIDPQTRRSRSSRHSSIALVVSAVLLVHILLGTYHGISG